MSTKDNLQKLRDLNTRLDPKVDSLLQRVVNSPYTPLFAIAALILAGVLWVM